MGVLKGHALKPSSARPIRKSRGGRITAVGDIRYQLDQGPMLGRRGRKAPKMSFRMRAKY